MNRKEFLKNPKKNFHEYYVQIAKDLGIKPSKYLLSKVKKALERGDENLNSIPLFEWDIRAVQIGYNERIRKIFRKYGDMYSLAGMVCALKEIYKEYAEQSGYKKNRRHLNAQQKKKLISWFKKNKENVTYNFLASDLPYELYAELCSMNSFETFNQEVEYFIQKLLDKEVGIE